MNALWWHKILSKELHTTFKLVTQNLSTAVGNTTPWFNEYCLYQAFSMVTAGITVHECSCSHSLSWLWELHQSLRFTTSQWNMCVFYCATVTHLHKDKSRPSQWLCSAPLAQSDYWLCSHPVATSGGHRFTFSTCTLHHVTAQVQAPVWINSDHQLCSLYLLETCSHISEHM